MHSFSGDDFVHSCGDSGGGDMHVINRVINVTLNTYHRYLLPSVVVNC